MNLLDAVDLDRAQKLMSDAICDGILKALKQLERDQTYELRIDTENKEEGRPVRITISKK